MCFINPAVKAYLEQREPISSWEYPHRRKYSIEKLIQLPQGNKVVEAPDSNIDGFLWSDTCVSSCLLNRHIWRKQSLFPP
jgi:hypothetical protein